MSSWLSRWFDVGEHHLREALAFAPGAIALFDAHDRLVFCNNAYLDMTPEAARPVVVPGAEFETIIRAVAAAGAYPDYHTAEDIEQFIVKRLASHRAADGEFIRRIHGDTWMLSQEQRTPNGCTLCTYRDITPLKQKEIALRRSEQAARDAREEAEQARNLADEASRAKSAFLAAMSHELRTPLNAIIGFAQVMEQGIFGKQPDRYGEYTSLIRRSGQHLLAIINDILDLAKVQSGKTELNIAVVPVASVLDESVAIVGPRAAEAGLTLSVHRAADLGHIEADATRIKQVLINLLHNAIKFTPRGGSVSLNADMHNGAVVLAVTDTGIGMSATDIPKALELFGQVSSAVKAEHEGAGLGLPLSKSLVELHGGTLTIASQPGIGTTVTVILPSSVGETAPSRQVA